MAQKKTLKISKNFSTTDMEIKDEIYSYLKNIKAIEIMAIINSWKSSLDDKTVLSMLKDINKHGKAIKWTE
jgi:hypothetical protein